MVASASKAPAVAGAISAQIRQFGRSEMQAIGPAAINVAVKAIAIARGHCAPAGFNLVTIPAFLDVMIGGDERTAIHFVVRDG